MLLGSKLHRPWDSQYCIWRSIRIVTRIWIQLVFWLLWQIKCTNTKVIFKQFSVTGKFRVLLLLCSFTRCFNTKIVPSMFSGSKRTADEIPLNCICCIFKWLIVLRSFLLNKFSTETLLLNLELSMSGWKKGDGGGGQTASMFCLCSITSVWLDLQWPKLAWSSPFFYRMESKGNNVKRIIWRSQALSELFKCCTM